MKPLKDIPNFLGGSHELGSQWEVNHGFINGNVDKDDDDNPLLVGGDWNQGMFNDFP